MMRGSHWILCFIIYFLLLLQIWAVKEPVPFTLALAAVCDFTCNASYPPNLTNCGLTDPLISTRGNLSQYSQVLLLWVGVGIQSN